LPLLQSSPENLQSVSLVQFELLEQSEVSVQRQKPPEHFLFGQSSLVRHSMPGTSTAAGLIYLSLSLQSPSSVV